MKKWVNVGALKSLESRLEKALIKLCLGRGLIDESAPARCEGRAALPGPGRVIRSMA